MITPLFFGVIFAAILIFAIAEISHLMVFGKFIPEDELDAYFNKYLANSRLNQFSETMLTDMPKYASCSSQSFLSKWSVETFGTIPRWSKWSKKLDERRAALMPQKVKLSQL